MDEDEIGYPLRLVRIGPGSWHSIVDYIETVLSERTTVSDGTTAIRLAKGIATAILHRLGASLSVAAGGLPLTRETSMPNDTIEPHKPHRGSDVEAFLKIARDSYRKNNSRWFALDTLLDDYRFCADHGYALKSPLDREEEPSTVSSLRNIEDPQPEGDDLDIAARWLESAELHLSDAYPSTSKDAHLAVAISRAHMQLWSLRLQRDHQRYHEEMQRKQAERMPPPPPFYPPPLPAQF